MSEAEQLRKERDEALERARQRALLIVELKAEVRRYKDRLRAVQVALRALSAEEVAAI